MMDAINGLLIHGADAVLWLWETVKNLLGGLGAVLDAILNPILSPLLAALNPIATVIGDVVYAILRPAPAWLGLMILSALTGVAMLIAFRYVSNQPAIGRAKDDIKANLLALKLYKDELRVTFQTQWRLLGAILRLQRYMLTPVLVMLLPVLLVLAQMGTRHQWRPLQPGEQTLIKMKLADRAGRTFDPNEAVDATIERNDGAVVEVGPIPGGGELVWRIRGGEPGRHTLRFRVGAHVLEKDLLVGAEPRRVGAARVSAARVGADWTAQLLHPVERRLPTGTGVQSIEIDYPGVDSRIHGTNWWVLTFFVVSMAAALVLRPLFRVRF